MIEEIDKHRWRAREEKELPVLHYNNYSYTKALLSKNPQSVVKVIGYREGVQETKNTIEYIARAGKEDELALEDEDGLEIKGKDAIAGLVNEWADDFDKINEDSKKRNRDSTHIMLSADIEPNEENKEILQNVARDFLRREFFDKGYSFVFVVHNDTQHPHIHAVIKNKPIRMEIKPGVWKRRKLELNPNDLLHLREQFAIEMKKYGLEQVVTLRKDNPHKHLEDIEKRIFGDAEYGYKGVKEKINWYRSKLEEKDWKFEDKNIRQYSAYLQMELMKIKDQIKNSNISRKDKTKLNLEYRKLMKTLDLARRDKESEQLKHMVQNFKDKTLESIENFQKRNITISELIDKNIESYEEVKKEAGLRVEERLLKIKEKLTGDYPSLSVKDAEYLGIDTSNLTTFSKRIEYKEKVLVSDVEDSKEIYEEIDKSYDADFIDLKSLDLSNININQETSKLKEEILVRQKTNLISKTIEPLQEYLENQIENLTLEKYKFLENRLIKIKDKLTGDYPSLSVKDAEFIGIDTSNLTTYEQEIKYKDKILASDLKTREEFIVREVGIEIKASDLLTKKEFVVEEISKTSIVENIDLVNLNLKDIQFKESKIEEAIKISQKVKAISESINPFINSLENQKDKISIEHYNKLEKRILNIKKSLEKDFPSLSVKDAEYLGINTDNLPKLEKVDITKEDGSTYTIHNIDLNKLDVLALNENIERIVTKEIEQEITNLNNELVPGRERVNISSNEIENLKQMTLNELKITNPKPVLDALGISYKEQYGRLTFKTHAEKTASSNMYLDKAGEWKYKNFATGSGGTVENVIMDLTGMPYKEALNYAISSLGTKNYLDERFEDVKHENSMLKEEHLEKIKQLKEANINYQKELSSESKVVKIEEIYSTDKEVMDFLSKRGIENIADGFYKITGQYEVNGKTFYNTGIGVLTNEHNIDSNLEEVGADIHLLKPITLKNGNVLKTMSFGNKDITTINNKDTNTKIAIFESKMDYAAAYSQDIEKFENTTSIIANGTGNYFKIVQELEKINVLNKDVVFYNQNDKAGEIFITQIATKSNLEKFSFVKYQDNETGKDINDILKDNVNIEDRFLKEKDINDFISISKNKDDLEKVLNENIKIELKENNLIEETNLIFDKDDESGFSKSITIERNAENFRKIISEKEEILKDEYKLQRLDEIKRYINKTNPSLSISDAQFLGIDVNKFQKTTKEIPYKVFDFSSSEAMKKEFKEFANSFPKFAKDMLNEAIDKQEISFEKLSYIGIKPTQFKNLTNNDFENEKADLTNNKELLKEFHKLSKDFPKLAQDELIKSVKKNNITTGKLAKYGMNPESFANYNKEQIFDKNIKIDFIDFENNNIYKKDFVIKIDYEDKEKINPIKNIIQINSKTFQTVPNDFFKNKDLKTIDKNDLNIHNLKHLKALENSDIGFFTIKSTSSKLLESQAGLTNLINQATSIEKAIEDVDKSKVSIFQKIDHKDKLKILKKDFVKNVAKLIKNAEIILDNSLLIQKSKDDDFKNKYINEGLQNFTNNPKKLDDAFVKECKKQNNFEISYSDFKIDFLKNELKEDKKSLNSTLENYKYTLEKSLKTINKELGIMEKARSSLVIKEQLKKIDKVLSRGIEL
ncbi:relaxase/mobilization nuclease domain-containing protein [Aliarcobacter thereius]|uniref:relaxase/mobilization nuclease domain-containing protein n=1 Tax=Aliarcobacter thereius TaxID=544718 RepID=UPI0008268B2E|nr:hypothetical protein [Aliarcobacter thereius]OCL90575.1 hypothetical protein AAX25_01673 [Aliarcobacter thereius]